MKNIHFGLILSFFSLCMALPEELKVEKKTDTYSVVSLKTTPQLITGIDGFTRLAIEGEGHTSIPGMPELPKFSTLYQLDKYKEYNFEIEVKQSYTINNISVIPHQGTDKGWDILQINTLNTDFYGSENTYPEENLYLSDRIPGRGIDLITLQIIPYIYSPEKKELKVLSEIEIHVHERGERQPEENSIHKRSRVFDNLYKGFTLNFESSARNEDYQDPAILYICGGSAESNSDFLSLVDWRKQRGYTVYTASLGETGSSTTSIKNYISNAFNTFDPPPEYVALVGDVDGSYAVPTYYNGFGHNSYGNECEGDHPYSQIIGTDLIPEVLMGRISIRTGSELSTIASKVINYEKATYLEYVEDYYEKAAMAGDPSTSGNSCAVTKEQVSQIISAHGMEDVRLKTSGSSWSSWMENQLEEGVLFFNYRGYLGMSGFGSGNVDAANNGFKLPFATVLTCGTGSFSEETTTMTEKLLRAGTSSNPRGAVAALGTATWNTHTLFNNIVDMGTYQGLFADEVETAGAALASGKLALLNTYPNNTDDWVSAFTQWNNLMGDPATHLFTDTPTVLSVAHESSVTEGTNFLDVSVHNENGDMVQNALVSFWSRFLESPVNQYTDSNGMVTLDIDGLTSGSYNITVTKNNHQPYLGILSISSTGAIITVLNSDISIGDDTGNNDGVLNPGETVDISIPISNSGTENLSGISAILTADSYLVSITSGTQNYGSINTGESVEKSFSLQLAASAIQHEDLGLRLQVSDDSGNSWNSEIRIDVLGSYLVIDGNVFVEPGQSTNLNIQLNNVGSLQESGVFAILSSEGNQIEVLDGNGTWSDIPAGDSGTSWDGFEISATSDIVHGTMIPLTLHIQSGGGYNRIETLLVQAGTVSVTDPLGPDNYGYYMYDSGDTYDLAPQYNWIEIDPSYGGDGTDLNLSNSGDGNWSGNGSIAHVNLPFTFRFYGIDYNEITVSTNGWVAMGSTDVQSFRNYPIPGAGGPSPMIAAFWDDLETTSSGDVFTYADPGNQYLIIEWSDMRTNNYNSLETFQMILENSSSPPYGDGNIKIQYKVFNNTSSGIWNSYPPIHGGYATIGVENQLANVGLQYTYYNQYPTAAMRLDDETALYITTSPPVSLPSPGLHYTLGNTEFELEAGASMSAELEITNNGEEGSELTYSVSTSGIPPFENAGGGPDTAGNMWSDSELEATIGVNWVDIEGMGILLEFPQNDTGDDPVDIGFDFPFYGESYSQVVVNPNGWIGFGEDNTAFSNTTLPSVSAPGPAIFGFWDDLNPVSGDQGGCPEGAGNIYVYSDGSQCIIWFDTVARCANNAQYQGTYDFQFVLHSTGDIDLNYREMTGYTSSATIGMQNANGSSGLHIAYNNSYAESDKSIHIRKMDNADWLSLSGNLSGTLMENESAVIDLNLNAEGLSEGEYSANLHLHSNAQSSLTFPVLLSVVDDGNMVLGDINGDGEINVLDVVGLVNSILGGGEYLPAGDMNQDGTNDILDVVTLVNAILG
ncbi:MAG: C25 family cysteine peptidase [Candidatus Marinimicrobia bacterium]|nr:C25 family cysteine peptidase [Candidatus Neomarinimicrobiota bacterium]